MSNNNYLLSKDECTKRFGNNSNLPEVFENQTGISNAVAIPATELENLQKKYGLYNLKNIQTVNQNTGSIECNRRFSDLMKKRKEDTFSARVKRSGEWQPGWWFWILASVVAFCLWVFVFTPMAKRQAKENEQIMTANKLAQSGAWGENRYKDYKGAQIPGPLDINLQKWYDATEVQKRKDSLQKSSDSVKNLNDSLSASLQKVEQSEIAPINQRIAKVKDSTLSATKKTAQEILTKASEELKASNKQGGGMSGIDGAYIRSEQEQKRAARLLQSVDSVINAQTMPLLNQITTVKDKYKKIRDSLQNNTTAIEERVKKIMPKVESYPYDLLQPEQYIKTSGSTSVWWFKWITIVTCLIFIGCVIYLLYNLPKRSHDAKEQYTAKNIRVMAGLSMPQSNSNNGQCKITFHNTSERTVEKIISAKMSYSWNALVHPDSFEFSEPLLDHEKLTDEQKANAPKPLFYVTEGNLIIIYSGLASQASKEEIKATDEPLIL